MVSLTSAVKTVNHRPERFTIKPHQTVAHRIGAGRFSAQMALPPSPRSSPKMDLHGIETSQPQNKKQKNTVKDRLRGNTRMVTTVAKTAEQSLKTKYPIHISKKSPEQLLLFLF
jgi:hypothetical protein